MKKFALIGAAGFVASRHMKAIKETGNLLVAALDKHDCVGILDSYFPDASFFVEFERFDRHLEKLRYEKGDKVDYVSICSPNYLHDAHIRFALRIGADAICEKPLVLNPWNVESLEKIEVETGRKVNTILQLRLHPAIKALKEKIEKTPSDKQLDIELTYITSRGRWYEVSWKGDISKSGGVTTNIGIHFFDMLLWIFGKAQGNILHVLQPNKAAGVLELQRARVKWFLSLDSHDLPAEIPSGMRTYRSLKLGGEEFEFSEGFTDLHVESYRKIIAGEGFGTRDALPSIELVSQIRTASPVGLKGEYHPILKKLNLA